MGKSSGGVNNYANVSGGIAISASGRKLSQVAIRRIKASAQSITTLSDREVVLQLQKGISRYASVMGGVRERVIKVANMDGYYGVTMLNSNSSEGIYLNKGFFNRKRNVVESEYRKQYDSGFKNRTNRPIQHTITHELAHSTWVSGYNSPKHRAAGVEIRSLYKKWQSDTKKKGYGTYASKNVDEFWAEAVTKAVHGKSDKYTRAVKEIAKKYKL